MKRVTTINKKVQNTLWNQSGISLIELVIYIALTALLLVINLGVLVNILKVRAETIEMQDLDFALNDFGIAITQDLRWAETGTIYNGGIEGEVGDTLIISRDPASGTEEIKYRYDSINETVIKTEPSGAEFQVSPDSVAITNFEFENLAPSGQHPSIKVTIEGYGKVSLRKTPITVSTTVSIRRKSV